MEHLLHINVCSIVASAISALTLLVGHPTCKKTDGMVICLEQSANASVKSRKVYRSGTGPGSPGWSQTKGCKMVVVVAVVVASFVQMPRLVSIY